MIRFQTANLFLLVITLGLGLPAQAKFDQTHGLFSKSLGKYVCTSKVPGTHRGLIKYADWQKDTKNLDLYLNSISVLNEKEFEKFSANEKEAFWINAYNACAIKAVLRNYPFKQTNKYNPANSIQQVDNFWEKEKFKVLGQEHTLYDIEHAILRKQFACHDPRVHFAVVAAAKGSPEMPNSAYQGSKLDLQLEDSIDGFMARKENLTIDPSKKLIRVSQIFKWFPLDFSEAAHMEKKNPPPSDDEIVLAYLKIKYPNVIPKDTTRVVYSSFNWELNECK